MNNEENPKMKAIKRFQEMFPNQRKELEDMGLDYEEYIKRRVEGKFKEQERTTYLQELPQNFLESYLNSGYEKQFIQAAWLYSYVRYPDKNHSTRLFIFNDIIYGRMPL